MTADLETLGRDLETAFARHLALRSRRKRRHRVLGLATASAAALCAAALGSGLTGGLNLDPATWSILGGGTVDAGRGEYVSAARVGDGSQSLFLVEHDDGLSAYNAFLLHEKTIAAARAASAPGVESEPGPLCSPAALTQVESAALRALRAGFSPGADLDATKAVVDRAIGTEFAAQPCQGLQYGGEQARLFFAGIEPQSKLMPGVN